MKQMNLLAVSTFLALTAFGASSPAIAQINTERPISLIVPFSPGGATDMVGRIMAQELAKRLEQPVIVENRAGAGGSVGMGELSRTKPDGFTYALITDSIPIQTLLNDKLTWSMDDFQGISKIATSPEVLVVHPDVPVNSVDDFISYVQKEGSTVSYAASSTGSVHHLAGEAFKQQNDVDMVHIPYKGGGQSLIDMVAGRVDAGFIGLAPVLSHLNTGKLHALALTGDQRHPLAPDVPTFKEAGHPEFDVELWIGMVGQKDLPQEAVTRMKNAIDEALSSEEVQDKLRNIGFEAAKQDGADFPSWLTQQQNRWKEVIDKVGMKKE